MKKLFTAILLMCCIGTANAQFTLTPQGVKNTINPEQDFFTLDFEGKTTSDLYNATLVQITKMFVSPKEVISKVDNEAITISGIGEIVAKNASGIKSTFNMMFTLSIQFKDNRIRINDPNIIRMTAEIGTNELVIQGGAFMGGSVNIFSKKGEIKNAIGKETIELFFNSLVSNIEDGIKQSDNADW